jgi:hypothetical protein
MMLQLAKIFPAKHFLILKNNYELLSSSGAARQINAIIIIVDLQN